VIYDGRKGYRYGIRYLAIGMRLETDQKELEMLLLIVRQKFVLFIRYGRLRSFSNPLL